MFSGLYLVNVGEESRAYPLTAEVVEAGQTGESTDERSVGGRPHPSHLEPGKQCF